MRDDMADKLGALRELRALIIKLAQTTSINGKKAILVETLDKSTATIPYLFRALTATRTFGVAAKTLASITVPAISPMVAYGLHDDEVLGLLDKLESRELTGDAAKAAIGDMILKIDSFDLHNSLANMDEPSGLELSEVFKRILLKDLRCNTGMSLLNKALTEIGAPTGPTFDVQLADSTMPSVTDIRYPVFVEPKYDGVRCAAIIDDFGNIQLMSRNGIRFENFAEIEEDLKATRLRGVVLDGEIVASGPIAGQFQRTMHRAKASPGKHTDIVVNYHIFDAVPENEFLGGIVNPIRTNYARRDFLKKINLADMKHGVLKITPYKVIYNANELTKLYSDYVADGYEGIIVKQPMAPYAYKRSANWQKLKPMETMELEVIGVTEGTGKYAGKLGSLILAGIHDGKEVSTECGSGFDDNQRTEMWLDKPIGSVAEIKYQEITKAENEADYSLRFPVFLRLRPIDSSTEKL
jgi:ATP-dependent DNA ligase